MIVRHRPNSFRMLFIIKGSILQQILPQLLLVFILSITMSLLDHWFHFKLQAVPMAIFSLIGLTLSIFLGFRNNACYDRWWEARKMWGSLIAQMNHLIRDSKVLPLEVRGRLLYRLIAFSHSLKTQLRQQDLPGPDNLSWVKWLPESEQDHALRQSLTQHDLILQGYPTQYILNQAHQDVIDCIKQQQLSDTLYLQLNQHIIEVANIQVGCERILNTPLPFAYSLLLHRTAYAYCLLLPFALSSNFGFFGAVLVTVLAYTFFGLDALGNELEEPFGISNNDLPLDAMVRAIEINLLSALDSKEIPKPLTAVDFVLT